MKYLIFINIVNYRWQWLVSSFFLFLSGQLIDGEMYPPSVADASVRMSYPPGVPAEAQMAIGQEVFGLLPGLGMYATLWLREHNRVCDILKAEHPTWDDEQLFQTTRLIIIGELDTVQKEQWAWHCRLQVFSASG